VRSVRGAWLPRGEHLPRQRQRGVRRRSRAGAQATVRIEKGLEEALGYESITFLRSAGELAAIVSSKPFEPAAVEGSKGKLQVVMLTSKPAAKARKAVLAHATDKDRLAFGGRELYWLPAGGTQDSELDWRAIAGVLGPTTMRTKGTVEQIAAKHFSD